MRLSVNTNMFEEKNHSKSISRTEQRENTRPHRVVVVLHFACFTCTYISLDYISELHKEHTLSI